MKRLAICLGLTKVDPSAYGGWSGKCPGSDRDVARFATACHDAGFDGVTVLVNEFADFRYVKGCFLETVERLRADDLLVLFFSGHGGQWEDVNGDEVDGKDETLAWWSGECVDDKIADYLGLLPVGCRVWYVTDSCNSGSNYRGMNRRTRSTPVRLNPRIVNLTSVNILHFGGCADGRYSYGDDKGGDFTNALIDSIKKARKHKTYGDIFKKTKKKMPSYQTFVSDVWGEDFSKRVVLT